MNRHAFELWKWTLGFVALPEEVEVLDIGCGGGDIRLMAEIFSPSRIYDIDISVDMVALLEETARGLVDQGMVEIYKYHWDKMFCKP